MRLRFFSAPSRPAEPARPKSVSSPEEGDVAGLAFLVEPGDQRVEHAGVGGVDLEGPLVAAHARLLGDGRGRGIGDHERDLGTLDQRHDGQRHRAAQSVQQRHVLLVGDHLGHALHGLGRVAAVVLEVDLDLAAQHAARGVGFGHRQLRTPARMLAESGHAAGHRNGRADHDRSGCRLGGGQLGRGGDDQAQEKLVHLAHACLIKWWLPWCYPERRGVPWFSTLPVLCSTTEGYRASRGSRRSNPAPSRTR